MSFFSRKREAKKIFKDYLKNKEHYEQLTQYLKMETMLPSLHIVKQKNIQNYQKDYGYKILIETGTFLGDMVEAQKNHFEKLLSIELGEDLYHKAMKRFEFDSHVTILQGDSGAVIRDIINDISEPALFWLDGHYSEGITAKGNSVTPILKELEAIFSSHYEHGILIDDARLFTGRDDYPTIDALCLFVHKIDSSRKVEIADDIIRIFKR